MQHRTTPSRAQPSPSRLRGVGRHPEEPTAGAEDAKAQFLATATHELKTPLTVIMGYSELLLRRDDLSDDQRTSALRSVHNRARQLSAIVDQLLLSSQVADGRVEVDSLPLDVGEILEERVLVVQERTARRVDLRIPDGLPPVIADRRALATVIDQLLDNATKFSGPETAVSVAVGPVGDGVTIRITDRGIGMNRDQADRCFEQFWQADRGDVRRFAGTGIGLYLAKSLVEAMDGVLVVETRPRRGSTFEMRLPRAAA